MVVVCTGPESSGTRLLHQIVTECLGVEAIHRSVPHGDLGLDGDGWWRPDEYSDERYIVIVRRPDVTALSALAHNHVASLEEHRGQWRRAIDLLAMIPGAYWLTYEALLAAPDVQTANLAAWLGVTPSGPIPAIHDMNARWLSAL